MATKKQNIFYIVGGIALFIIIAAGTTAGLYFFTRDSEQDDTPKSVLSQLDASDTLKSIAENAAKNDTLNKYTFSPVEQDDTQTVYTFDADAKAYLGVASVSSLAITSETAFSAETLKASAEALATVFESSGYVAQVETPPTGVHAIYTNSVAVCNINGIAGASTIVAVCSNANAAQKAEFSTTKELLKKWSSDATFAFANSTAATSDDGTYTALLIRAIQADEKIVGQPVFTKQGSDTWVYVGDSAEASEGQSSNGKVSYSPKIAALSADPNYGPLLQEVLGLGTQTQASTPAR